LDNPERITHRLSWIIYTVVVLAVLGGVCIFHRIVIELVKWAGA